MSALPMREDTLESRFCSQLCDIGNARAFLLSPMFSGETHHYRHMQL